MPRKVKTDRAESLSIQVSRLEDTVRELLQKRLDAVRAELGTRYENLAFRVLLVRLLKMEQELNDDNNTDSTDR